MNARLYLAGLALAAALAGCANGPKPPPAEIACFADGAMLAPGCGQVGEASYYAASLHGERTANGEIYNQRELSAAHRAFPLGSYLEVENLANHRRVIVRVNDRGPYAQGRILDLSRRAANELDFIHDGEARVHVRYLGDQPPAAEAREGRAIAPEARAR